MIFSNKITIDLESIIISKTTQYLLKKKMMHYTLSPIISKAKIICNHDRLNKAYILNILSDCLVLNWFLWIYDPFFIQNSVSTSKALNCIVSLQFRLFSTVYFKLKLLPFPQI